MPFANLEPTPVLRPRRAARHSYDRLSRWYDWLTGAERRLNARVLRRLALPAGGRHLEIGSGTGHGLRLAAELVGPAGIPLGLDLSPAMCRRARRRLEDAGHPSRLMVGDAVRLPFPAGAFDTVFTGFTLELFDTPDIPQVLAEIERVLRPAGRLGVVSLSLSRGRTWPVRLYESAHRAWPHLIDCRPIPVAAVVTNAGFTPVTIQEEMAWRLPITVVIARKPNAK